MVNRPLALILVLILLVSFMPAEAGFSRSLVKKAATSPKAENVAVLEAENTVVQPVNALIERVHEWVDYEVFRDELDDLDIEHLTVSRRTPAIAGEDVRLVMTLRNNGNSDIENAVMEIDYQYEHANNLQINLPRVIESGQAVYLFPVLYFPQPMNYELLFTISAANEEETYNHELEIEANPEQQAPVVYDIPDFDFDEFLEEGEPIHAYDLDNYVTDANNDEISWEATGNAEIETIRNQDNEVSYSAPVYYNEDHTLTWTADDGEDTDSDDSLITINDINTAPFFEQELPDQAIDEDTTDNEINIDLWEYAQDHDNDNDELSYEITEQTNTDLINCHITNNRYLECNDPGANLFGHSEITIQVADEELTAEDSLTITIESVNDIPEIGEVTVEPNQEDPGIFEGRDEITITINFHDNDAENEDGETLTFTVYEQDHEDEPVCEEDATGEETATCTINPLETGEYTYIAKIEDDEEGEDTEEIPLTINELYTVNGVITQLFAEEDLDDESPVEGATVHFEIWDGDYEEEVETNEDGEYTINLEQPGEYRVIVTHDDYYERTTYPDEIAADGEFNANIVPEPTQDDTFSMEFFEIVCRGEMDATMRWEAVPDWYIITEELDDNTEEPTEEQLNLARSLIQEEDELFYATNGHIGEDPEIEEGGDIYFDEEPWNTFYWTDIAGPAHGEWDDEGVIYSAASHVDMNEPDATYRQEMVQTMGCTRDNEGDNAIETILSIYNDAPLDRAPTYQIIDGQAGKLVYSRPVGNVWPDEDPNPFNDRRLMAGVRNINVRVYYNDGEVLRQTFPLVEGTGWNLLDVDPRIKEFFNIPDGKDVYYNVDTHKMRYTDKETVNEKKVKVDKKSQKSFFKFSLSKLKR